MKLDIVIDASKIIYKYHRIPFVAFGQFMYYIDIYEGDNGIIVKCIYDENKNLVEYFYIDSSQTSDHYLFEYDDNNNCVKKVDVINHVEYYFYYNKKLLNSILKYYKGQLYEQVIYKYDKRCNRLLSIDTPDERYREELQYNEHGLIIKRECYNYTLIYEYNDNGTCSRIFKRDKTKQSKKEQPYLYMEYHYNNENLPDIVTTYDKSNNIIYQDQYLYNNDGEPYFQSSIQYNGDYKYEKGIYHNSKDNTYTITYITKIKG